MHTNRPSVHTKSVRLLTETALFPCETALHRGPRPLLHEPGWKNMGFQECPDSCARGLTECACSFLHRWHFVIESKQHVVFSPLTVSSSNWRFSCEAVVTLFSVGALTNGTVSSAADIPSFSFGASSNWTVSSHCNFQGVIITPLVGLI